MKFKVLPEDFKVEELARWEADPDGDYSIYKVWKRKLTSFEVIDRIRRHTGLDSDSVSFAGLKDRQAVSTQYIALKGRRIRGSLPGIRCSFVAKAKEPLSSRNLIGNQFTIVVRDLSESEADRYRRFAEVLPNIGVPNYFADQRFGSIRAGQGFVAREIILGHYEQALRILLGHPGVYDPPSDKARKGLVRSFWGQWGEVAKKVRGGPFQSILLQLAKHPGDYRRALDALPARARAVHLLAYQAYLWNESVGHYLRSRFPDTALCQSYYSCDRHIFWKEPYGASKQRLQELRSVEFPLINHETNVADTLIQSVLQATLHSEGLTFQKLQLRPLRHAFFLEVPRKLVLVPRDMTVSEVQEDERHENRKKLTLSFTLPPGSYATLVLDRIFKTQNLDSDHVIERFWHKIPQWDQEGRFTEDSKKPAKKRKPRPVKLPKEEPEEEDAIAVKAPSKRKRSRGKKRAAQDLLNKARKQAALEAAAKETSTEALKEVVEKEPRASVADSPKQESPKIEGQATESEVAPEQASEAAPEQESEVFKKRGKKKNPRKVAWKGLGARKKRREERESKQKKQSKQKKSKKQRSKDPRALIIRKERKERRKQRVRGPRPEAGQDKSGANKPQASKPEASKAEVSKPEASKDTGE